MAEALSSALVLLLSGGSTFLRRSSAGFRAAVAGTAILTWAIATESAAVAAYERLAEAVVPLLDGDELAIASGV